MALARIARQGYKRSGGSVANYAKVTDVLSDRASSDRCLSPLSGNFTTFHESVAPRVHSRFLSSISMPTGTNSGSRGIRTTPQLEFAQAQRVVEESDTENESLKYPTLEATKPGQKPRVVVLGSGWAACRFLKWLDTRVYDAVCISPRNHMVFTPLLASTCVGTLEFRSVAEPVTQIQAALAKDPNSYFFLASCTDVDMDKHEVSSTAYIHVLSI